MQSNVPDAWVIGAIVLVGAAIVLAISALRLGAVDQRPASPLDAPTAAPAATFPATIAPTSPATNAPAPAGDTTSTTASPRVLTPGGWAILQVPMSLSSESTYEDFSIRTASGREQAFGQADHVRIYGRDYKDRLDRAGFMVSVFKWTTEPDRFGGPGNRFGLNEEEDVYVATKPRQ